MNDASLDILRACGSTAGSLFGVAMAVPVYAAIWTLARLASEPRRSLTRAQTRARVTPSRS